MCNLPNCPFELSVVDHKLGEVLKQYAVPQVELRVDKYADGTLVVTKAIRLDTDQEIALDSLLAKEAIYAMRRGFAVIISQEDNHNAHS